MSGAPARRPSRRTSRRLSIIPRSPTPTASRARRRNMSSSDATTHGHGGHEEGNPHLAHHFDSMATQNHASRLGMWLFLGTEVLLFAGLFLGYAVYRHFYHDTFKAASHHLNLIMGTVNTVVLISSSFTVAMAYYSVKKGNNKAAAGLLIFTIMCALTFLCIKA